MKKVVEINMFDKNNNKIMTKVFDTKTIKGLAQINKISELEYDCDAQVRLAESIVEIVNAFANRVNNNVHHFIIYNDYCESADVFEIGDVWPMETIGQCPRYAK